MSNNSTSMSLEDRIVQEIKDQSLFKLVGDEDAIRNLVERAVKQAIFEPRTTGAGYERRTTDSIAIATAKEVAKKAAADLLASMCAELAKDESFQKAVAAAISAQLPAAISGFTASLVISANEQTKVAVMNTLTTAANDGMLRMLTNNYSR